MDSVEEKVVKQVEYYFGDINLPKDRFLQEEMRMNGDGWVRLGELMKFNRLKRLCDEESRVMNILAAKCTLLEVDANEHRVRRRPERTLPRDKVAFARDLLPRSVYVKGFRLDSTLDDIQAYFLRCGIEAEAVRMRRRRDTATKDKLKHTDDDDDDEADEAEAAAAEGDTKLKAGTDAESKSGAGKFPFKGSVFAVLKTAADAERFLKAPQASGEETADAALFDSAVQFEKKMKSEYFREKKLRTKAKRRDAQSAFELAKKGKFGDAARQAKDGESGAHAPGERPFDRGMLLRVTDVPQALLDFNELKKLFSAADVEIFADLVPASSAAVVRIKRAPSGMPQAKGDAAEKPVGTSIWEKLCERFGSAEKPAEAAEANSSDATTKTATTGDCKMLVLTYKGGQLRAEVICGEEENRFWKDLFTKWEAGGSNKQQRKGGKNKQKMCKRGKRKWNEKGKRNGKKQHGDGDDDDCGSGSDHETAKRAKLNDSDGGDE